MACGTRRTHKKRLRRNTRMGKARKRILVNKGSTPVFPIHVS